MSVDVEDKQKDGSALNANQLNAAEAESSQLNTNTPDKLENNALDVLGKGYTDLTTLAGGGGLKAGLKILLRSKKAKGGVIGAVVASLATAWIMNLGSGPGQVIYNAQVLSNFGFSTNQNFGDGRLGKLYKFARTVNTPQNRNMNFLGNKIADVFEGKLKTSGISIEYSSGRIKALIIDPNSLKGREAMIKLRQQGATRADITPLTEGENRGKIRIDLDTGVGPFNAGSAKNRRVALSSMVDLLGMNKITSSGASRLLKIRAGVDFHPLKNVARAADEDLKNFIARKREERAKRIEGNVDGGINASSNPTADEEGNTSPETVQGASDTADELNDFGRDVADTSGSNSTRAASIDSSIRAKLAAGTGFVGLIGTTCGLQAIGNEVVDAKWIKLVEPLMRFGMENITIGFQVMSGEGFTMDELNEITQTLTDSETNTAFSDAQSFQAITGQETTGPDIPVEAKPGNISKPSFFVTLDDIIASIPLFGNVCNGISSTLGGWALSAVGILVSATGPVSIASNLLFEIAQNQVLSQVLPGIIGWVSGNVLNTSNAFGAIAGNYATYGVRLAANDQYISQGGVELTDAESTELALDSAAMSKSRLENESLYARYLDTNNYQSLASKLAYESVPSISNGSFASYASLPFKTISSTLGTIFGKKAFAAPAYDFGFPEYGFSLSEIDSDTYDNPYENAAKVEPKLDYLNKTYGEPCFGVTIDPATSLIVSGKSKSYVDIAKSGNKCKDKSNVELTQYRFYLADMTTALSAACYEGIDDEACKSLGATNFVNQSSATTTTSSVATYSKQELQSSSTSIACATGTNDVGIQTGYVRGNPIQIRLCAIPGLESTDAESRVGNAFYINGANGLALVNSIVSQNVYSMVQAIESSGINVSATSSYRSMERQRQLYNLLGSSTAARPGYSNHQMGLAVDFSVRSPQNVKVCVMKGSVCTPPDDPKGLYGWLTKNATQYDYAQYKGEFWHWEPKAVTPL